jgi:hypothetical protein
MMMMMVMMMMILIVGSTDEGWTEDMPCTQWED